jgi:hypothetical protein
MRRRLPAQAPGQSGALTWDGQLWSAPSLKVVMVAPDLSKFTLNGSQTLKIDGYDRPMLAVSVHGKIVRLPPAKATGA